MANPDFSLLSPRLLILILFSFLANNSKLLRHWSSKCYCYELGERYLQLGRLGNHYYLNNRLRKDLRVACQGIGRRKVCLLWCKRRKMEKKFVDRLHSFGVSIQSLILLSLTLKQLSYGASIRLLSLPARRHRQYHRRDAQISSLRLPIMSELLELDVLICGYGRNWRIGFLRSMRITLEEKVNMNSMNILTRPRREWLATKLPVVSTRFLTRTWTC